MEGQVFDEDLKKDNEMKKLILETEVDYWIGNPVVQIIHGSLILDQNEIKEVSFNSSIEELLAKRKISETELMKQKGYTCEPNSIKESKLDQEDDNNTTTENSSNIDKISKSAIGVSIKTKELSTLVVLGIQNSKSPVEMCEFLKDQPYSNGIEEIRVIKTNSNIMYGMIIFFFSRKQCALFFEKTFGQRYNSIEDDVCILRFIEDITFILDTFDVKDEEHTLLFSKHASKNSSQASDLPADNIIPSSPPHTNNEKELKTKNPAALSLSYNMKQIEQQQVINCAICQDGLLFQNQQKENEQTEWIEVGTQSSRSNFEPILSIMCGHYFHAACLSKWQDSICPLCRYHQQPPKLSYCDVCRNSDMLWMCLVCGSINCGLEFRENSHVKMHFLETKHTYSMEIESKFVYDHSRDSFVHRLMQNLADGKIVEIEDQNSFQDQYEKDKEDKKGQGVLKEYEIQMSASLEAQRKYFKGKLVEEKRDHTKILSEQSAKKKAFLKELEMEKQLLAEEEDKLLNEENEFAKIKKQFLDLNTQKNELYKKEGVLSQKYGELGHSKEQKEEKQRQKLAQIKKDIESRLLEISDVQSHLKVNKKIIESGEDMSKSAILVIGAAQGKNKKPHKKSRR